ncbi:hypothetical protein FNV43_RR08574 [Rhamnella rubrinervis]|uniref:NB-ARC domain-containing protein n=1 Tax=Rhamnella rubrinervis TaxID=2594499 RepID=A0A8K0H9L5_9ROSA|nr:hypothetical protein FNV43_RR08574 [Rhamnella rubrinervis]
MVPRLKKLDSYILGYSAANNICFIGIHGMGGIGKSTLTEAYFMKMSHKFEGSVIIVTTRNENLLIERYKKCRAEYPDDNEALQLFCWKAFESIEPPEEFKKLSKEVVEYASNLSLALTVLGSLLGSKRKYLWESALCRLRKCPEKEIVGKLKISFDDLDEVDQRIFLDIACFFKGQRKYAVIENLDSCGSIRIMG